MYFHPLILTDAQKQRRSAACKEFARMCLDNIDRQHRLQAEAISGYCAKQQQSLQTLAEPTGMVQFVLGCITFTVPASLELMEASVRWGEMATEVQREVVAFFDRHAKELLAPLEDTASEGVFTSSTERARKG